MGGGGVERGSCCGGEWGAVAIPGWAQGEVGGLTAGGWVLWGEALVQGPRKEEVKPGCGAGGLCGAGAGSMGGSHGSLSLQPGQ